MFVTTIDCGPVPEIANGTVIMNDPNNPKVGATANVSCDDGFVLKKSTIICQVTGEWETTVCTIKGTNFNL